VVPEEATQDLEDIAYVLSVLADSSLAMSRALDVEPPQVASIRMQSPMVIELMGSSAELLTALAALIGSITGLMAVIKRGQEAGRHPAGDVARLPDAPGPRPPGRRVRVRRPRRLTQAQFDALPDQVKATLRPELRPLDRGLEL
jgi:hypothetical protein